MQALSQLSPWDIAGQQALASRMAKQGDEKAQLRQAVEGFEAVLIRKWLEVARSASLDPKEGMMASYESLRDDQLAAMISRQGGVGFVEPMLAQMLRQIENRVDPATLASQGGLTTGAQKAVSTD